MNDLVTGFTLNMFGSLDIWLSLDFIISFYSKFVLDMDSETSSRGKTSLDLHLSSEAIAASVQPDFLVISDSQPLLIDIDSDHHCTFEAQTQQEYCSEDQSH